MTIDPTKIHIESHGNPVWQQEQSFQDVMAEQLRHAPWIGLSLVIHGIAILILFAIPYEAPVQEEKVIKMEAPQKVEEIEEPEPPPEPPKEEKPKDEPVLQDAEVQETEVVNETFEDVQTVAESAFDSNQWNTAVGLGGGAGGKFGRRGGGRKGLGGGGKSTAQAIEAGLKWLKDHQDEEGKWDADEFMKHCEDTHCQGAGDGMHDIGLTGLALLAFLGDGSTMRSGPYQEVVKKAVLWLRDQQAENGLFGTDSNQHFIYDHAIAALAMCEAYGLSEYKLLRKYAQRGLDYLEQHRNPYGMWRYGFQSGDEDMSVTGWALLAYVSAKDFKLNVSTKVFEQAAVYIDSLTDPATGRTGYNERGGRSSRHAGKHQTDFPAEKSECMTGVAILCRIFLGQDPKTNPIMEKGADLLMSKKPVWNPKDGSIDMYYWYYATYALYQIGGQRWNQWSQAMSDAILKQQKTDGHEKGSWDPIGAWGADGGRVYSTAISVLTLEAYYRYARVLGGR